MEGRDGPIPPRPWEALEASLGMSLSDILGSLDRSKGSKKFQRSKRLFANLFLSEVLLYVSILDNFKPSQSDAKERDERNVRPRCEGRREQKRKGGKKGSLCLQPVVYLHIFECQFVTGPRRKACGTRKLVVVCTHQYLGWSTNHVREMLEAVKTRNSPRKASGESWPKGGYREEGNAIQGEDQERVTRGTAEQALVMGRCGG